MAKVGDALPLPEPGWIRIDNADSSINYEGQWTRIQSANYYNGTRAYTDSAYTAKLKFSFTGSGIRVVAVLDVDSTNMRVTIDGVNDGFVNIPTTPTQYMSIVYEKTGLQSGRHGCVIDYNCGWAQFDAVDILTWSAACLYLIGAKAYGMDNGALKKVADNWPALTDAEKTALFKATRNETASASDLVALGKFKVLAYGDPGARQKISLKAAPHDQLVLPKGLIGLASIVGIDKATLVSSESGGGVCKLLVTADGAAYQTYDFSTAKWRVIDHNDLAAVKASGVRADNLADIDRAAWDALTAGQSGVGFAYLPTIAQSSDTCAVDRLDLKVDMRGSWDRAAHGADYQYGYPRNDTLRVSLLSDGSYKINYAG